MRIVDTRGQQCPAPIIATKKALNGARKDESFQVITDSRTSFDNLTRFLTDNKTKYSFEESNGVFTLTVTKTTADTVSQEAEVYCNREIPHFTQGNFVIALTSDKMGTGDDKLGSVLIINFIRAVKDLDHLPSKIIFYNSGVMLGTDDSPVIEHLREIEKMGVSLLLCATCVDFYSVTEKIHIGTLSNMYEIAQAMASASSVIKP